MARLGELISPAPVIRCEDKIYPVLSMTMHDGILLQSERFKKSLASLDQSNYKVVQRNQLVVGFPIDEGVLYVQKVVDEGIMSPAYNVWDIKRDKIEPDYLELALHSPQAMDYYKSKLRGTTARRRSIPTAELLMLQVKLPDLNKQKEIVYNVEKVSELITLRKQQLEKLDELVKARFVELFGLPVSNSKKWNTEKMKDVAPAVNYLGDFEETVWLLNLDMVEAQTGRIIDYLYVPEEEVGNSTCTFDTSNVLYSKLRPYLNKVVIPNRCGYATSELLPLKPNPSKIERTYLAFMLRSDEFVNMINEKVAGAKMPRVSMSDFRDFNVPVPPMELQKQFTAFVEQTDKSKLAVQHSLAQLETLKKVLMQQYFG